MMIIRGVNVFPSQIEELILKQPGLAPHYVCELTKEGPLDVLTIRVEGEAGNTAAAAKNLSEAIKAYVGVSATIKVEAAGSIERSMGKAKRVIDKR